MANNHNQELRNFMQSPKVACSHVLTYSTMENITSAHTSLQISQPESQKQKCHMSKPHVEDQNTNRKCRRIFAASQTILDKEYLCNVKNVIFIIRGFNKQLPTQFTKKNGQDHSQNVDAVPAFVLWEGRFSDQTIDLEREEGRERGSGGKATENFTFFLFL